LKPWLRSSRPTAGADVLDTQHLRLRVGELGAQLLLDPVLDALGEDGQRAGSAVSPASSRISRTFTPADSTTACRSAWDAGPGTRSRSCRLPRGLKAGLPMTGNLAFTALTMRGPRPPGEQRHATDPDEVAVLALGAIGLDHGVLEPEGLDLPADVPGVDRLVELHLHLGCRAAKSTP